MTIYNKNYFEQVPGLNSSKEQRWKYLQIKPAFDDFCKIHKVQPINILEVGAGTGAVLQQLIRKADNNVTIKPTALEINPSSAKIIKKNIKNIKFFLGDITVKTPFPNKKFDLCLGIDLLEHLKNIDSGLKEISRISNYAIFKIPVEKTLLLFLFNVISLGHYRKNMVSEIGHIHWFSLHSLIKFLQARDNIISIRYTNISLYQYQKYTRRPLTMKNMLLKLFYGLSKAVFQISPRLNALLFCEHLVILVECQSGHKNN